MEPTTTPHSTSPLKKCPVCSKTQKELWKHLWDHVEDIRGAPKICPICEKSFSNSADIKRHFVVHTAEKPFSCRICSAKFTQIHTRKQHAAKQHGLPYYDDEDEDGDVDEDDDDDPTVEPETSVKQESSESNPKKCPICEQKFGNSYNLKIHMVVHTDERPFTCQLCKSDFRRKAEAMMHVRRRHRKANADPYVTMKKKSIYHNPKPWEEMGFSVKDIGAPAPAAKIKEEPKPNNEQRQSAGKVRCLHCKKTCSSLRDLRSHVRDRHLERKTTLDKSLALTDKNKKNIENACSVCSKAFARPESLRAHAVMHTRESPFQCSHCSLDFKYQSGVRRHIRKVHKLTSTGNFHIKEDSNYAMTGWLDTMKTSVKLEPKEEPSQDFQSCRFCHKHFMSPLALAEHIANHSDVEGTSSDVSSDSGVGTSEGPK